MSFDDKSQLLEIFDERISQVMRDGMRGLELSLLRCLVGLNRAKSPVHDTLIHSYFGR